MYTMISPKTRGFSGQQFSKYTIWFFLLFLPLFLLGCDENYDDDYKNLALDIRKPSNFPDPEYNYSLNPPTNAGFELGKKIFYDGRLASDGVVSCGFCHMQADAFTHHGHSLSHGVNDAVGIRNAPALQNLAYQSVFMWDGASGHLDLQPIIPLLSELEMNGSLPLIIEMMQDDAEYRKLFRKAFPNSPINSENMLKAIAQFMVMLSSSNSKFDKYRRNEQPNLLNDEELAGYAIFKQKCANCHATDVFTDNSFRNNGLAVNAQLNDEGRYRITLLAQDKFKFKVPSLRNVEVTAPYMHDGRFYTLGAVLDHYNSGVLASPTLDPILSQGGIIGIPLNDNEKSAIIAFLKTLTDEEFLSNPKFSEY